MKHVIFSDTVSHFIGFGGGCGIWMIEATGKAGFGRNMPSTPLRGTQNSDAAARGGNDVDVEKAVDFRTSTGTSTNGDWRADPLQSRDSRSLSFACLRGISSSQRMLTSHTWIHQSTGSSSRSSPQGQNLFSLRPTGPDVTSRNIRLGYSVFLHRDNVACAVGRLKSGSQTVLWISFHLFCVLSAPNILRRPIREQIKVQK